MALVSSLPPQSKWLQRCDSMPCVNPKGISKHRDKLVFCSKKTVSNEKSRSANFQRCLPTKRRDALVQILLSTVSFPLIMSNASAETDPHENFQIFTDETNKFKISIPQDWAVGAGEPNGFKSVTAFYPKEDTNSNVSVVITGIGPDFTRLESFGKVDEFAETLVSGLDRSWQRPPGLAAKLIDCKAAKGLYYIEYSLQNPGESCRHIFSAIGMASNGWYNRLYTVTGQYMEEESVKYKSNIEKAVSSFKFT